MNRQLSLIVSILIFISILIAPPVEAQIQVFPGNEDGSSSGDEYLTQKLKSVRTLVRRGNYDQALAVIESLMLIYDRNPNLTRELKNIYRGQKKYQELKAVVLEEHLADPRNFQILCQLGEAYFLNDSLELAKSTWERAFEVADTMEYNYTMLSSYYKVCGFYNEASSVLKRARILLGKPRLFANDLSDIFISQRNYAQAASEYLNILQSDYNLKETSQLSQHVISIYKESENPELVEDVILQAIRDDQDNPNLYKILGDIKLSTKNLTSAFQYYKTADSLSPSRGLFLENFVSLCYDNDAFTMAVEAGNYFLSKNLNRPPDKVFILKAKSLAELGMFNPAFSLLYSTVENADESRTRAEALFTAGDIYANKLADYDSATVMFTRIVEGGFSSRYIVSANMRLAEIHIGRGSFKQALSRLSKVLSIRGDRELIRRAEFLNAEIAFLTYDFDTALRKYNSLVADNPSGFYVNDCLDRLALLADAEGDTVAYLIADALRFSYADQPDSAVEAMKVAAEFGDSKAYQSVLYKLAGYYSEAGMWDAAAGAYEHYQTAFPEGLYTDRALFNLAEIYYNKISRPDKADLLLNQLVTDHPASPLIEKARAYLNIIKSS
ncbi:MAG: tetratricopeptide repeat protein [candidate division Zixibacteria bacterium]|nr:tetratricopeptide repeat protein [candidate division Zixibacteria bacterium]